MDTSPLPNTEPNTETSHNQRGLAALSYAWILSVPVLVFGKDDPFVGPHARQGTLLFILSVIAWFIPYAGYLIEILLGTAMVMGYVRAAQGHAFALPLSTGGISLALSRLATEWNRLWGRSLVEVPQETPPITPSHTNSERDNQLAACSYLWIASVLVADNDRGSERIRFHARQGVTIFLLSILSALLGSIGTYIGIVLLVASVAGFLSALSGQATRLPVIYQVSLHLPSLDAAWAGVKGRLAAIVNAWRKGKGSPSQMESRAQDTHALPDEREKSLAMLGYFLLGPVFLLSANASSFVSFHARQGLLLNAALLGLYGLYPTAYSGLAILLALTVLGASRSRRGIRSPLPIVAEAVDGIAELFTLTKHHANLPHLPPQPLQPPEGTQSLHDG